MAHLILVPYYLAMYSVANYPVNPVAPNRTISNCLSSILVKDFLGNLFYEWFFEVGGTASSPQEALGDMRLQMRLGAKALDVKCPLNKLTLNMFHVGLVEL